MPFLPEASQRTVALNVMSNHVASYKPMQLARNKQCITELVTKVARLDVTHVGFLVKRDGVVDSIHAAEGAGVNRSENFETYAARVPGVIGVAIDRPRPNEGDAARSAKPGE